MRYAPYPTYRGSGIEWVGQLPAHWEVKAISRLARSIQTGPFGSQLHEADFVDVGIPLINPVHIVEGRVVPDDHASVDQATADRLARHQVRTGDIVIGRRGEIGRCAVIGDQEQGWLCGTGSLRVRLLEGEPGYLSRIIGSAGFSGLLELNAVGTTMLNLNPTIVGRMQVPAPPIAEQLAIATFLDRKTAKLDTLVAKKRALIERLKEKRSALISRTVTRGIPPEAARATGLEPNPRTRSSGKEGPSEVPGRWLTAKLRHVALRIQTGGTPPTAREDLYEGGSIPWFGPASFSEQIVLTEPAKLLNALAVQENAARMFKPGATLIVTIGATLGKVSSLTREASCNQQITVVEFNQERVFPRFGTYQLKRLESVWRAIAPSATLPILSQEDIAETLMTLPALTEQVAIADFLDRETAKIDALVAKIEQAIERLQEYRTALITAAVTGKIDVRQEQSGLTGLAGLTGQNGHDGHDGQDGHSAKAGSGVARRSVHA